LITRALAAHPGAARSFQIHLKPAGDVPARMTWQEGGDEHDPVSGRHYAATLAADGVEIGEFHPAQVAEFIDTLHRVVGLPFDTDPSRWFMGAVAVVYFLALVSGLILLLPTLAKGFFALRLGQGAKRLWLDAHSVAGIATLPFHLVIAMTAVVFAFHDGIYVIQDTLIHEGRMAAQPRPGGAGTRPPAAMLAPADILARVQALSPTFEPSFLHYRQVDGPRAVVQVFGHDPKAISPRPRGGFVAVDPYSGRVTSADYLPGRQDTAHTTVASFFALHFGTYGGTPAKGVYFLLALAGAWLFYSGNLLWVETRRKSARLHGEAPVQRLDTRLMAAATVGVCLGCICGISFTLAAARWLHGQGAHLGTWHRLIYYAVFFGCIAWAFVRGAARSSADLLWLAAASTFLIPATTLAAWAIPSLGLGFHASAPALGVDATALAGSLGFAWMASARAKRVTPGHAGSVWSAT
ncbi:MAG: PepSY domain-containing protein, partial [Holophaga sp.]|nr:PepSY domain-containing protein [Holophaga sp.]